jgi:hypothetical protein
MAQKPHRGRIQAQGGGLEASESWSQDEPLTKGQGLSLLSKLKEKLSPREQELREKPFADAERFIKGAKGGVQAPLSQSFQNRKTKDVRVDIEVWNGFAFISIAIIILIVLWLLM